MTPRQIQVLMHYYANMNTTDYKTDSQVSGVSDAIQLLVQDGLLEDFNAKQGNPTKYGITDKGKVMSKYLLNVPLPLPHTGWRVPREQR